MLGPKFEKVRRLLDLLLELEYACDNYELMHTLW